MCAPKVQMNPTLLSALKWAIKGRSSGVFCDGLEVDLLSESEFCSSSMIATTV